MIQRLPQQTNAYHNQPTKHYYHYTTNETTLHYQRNYTTNIMACNTAAPAYTLVLPRVFGDNGHRRGVTAEQVQQVMESQNWGVIQGIDFQKKKDFRSGDNYNMFFVRWNTWTPQTEVNDALERGGTIEVDIDDFGHFWKIRRYESRDKTNKQNKHREVRVCLGGEKKNINMFAALAETDDSTPLDNQESDSFPVLGEIKSVTPQGVWGQHPDFDKEMDAFCETGLCVADMNIADQLQDRFDEMLFENHTGYHNEI